MAVKCCWRLLSTQIVQRPPAVKVAFSAMCDRRTRAAESGGLLERVRELQDAEIVPVATDDLDADGEPFGCEPGRH